MAEAREFWLSQNSMPMPEAREFWLSQCAVGLNLTLPGGVHKVACRRKLWVKYVIRPMLADTTRTY